MRDPNPTDTYQTKDFWLAAALLCCGLTLLRLEWHGGRAFFVFAEADVCRKASEAYWCRELTVAAKDFTDALRTLKDRLHSEAQEPSLSPDRTRRAE